MALRFKAALVERALNPARAATPARYVVARRALLIVALALLVDLGAITLAYWMARVAHGHDGPTDPLVLATIPCWLVVLFAYGLYSRHLFLEPSIRITSLLGAITVSSLFTIVIAFAGGLRLSRGWVVALWVLAFVLLATSRLGLQTLTHTLHRAGWLGQRALVIGNNGEARTLARVLRKRRHLGYEVVGFVGPMSGVVDELPVVSSIDDIRAAVIERDIAAVFVAGSDIGHEALNRIDKALAGLHVQIRTSLGVPHLAASRVAVQAVDGMAMLLLERIGTSDWHLRAKRIIDVSMAAFGLLVGLPVMAAIAVAIKLTDGGPVIFSQQRVGAGGELFTMYKFRTMVVDAELQLQRLLASNDADGVLFKMRRDPRVTRVGVHLRRLGLDELPQLFNVLMGEMSMVGPRPALPEEMASWTPELALRLKAKPGLTGLWQVSGRHELAFEDYIRYDLFYVENWSLGLDLRIIARTLPALLSRAGAF